MQLSNKFVCPQVCILVKAASQQFHRVVAMARKPRPHLPVALVMVERLKRESKKRRSRQYGLVQLTLLDCSLQRKRSLGEDGDNEFVSPIKRREQQEKNEGALSRTRGRFSSQSGSRGIPNTPRRLRGGQNIPTRSRGLPSTPTSFRGLPSSPAGPRGVRPNSGRLRSAAIAASAAVASVVAGCLF